MKLLSSSATLGLVSLLILSGCAGLATQFYDPDKTDMHDPTLDLTRKDYRNLPFVEPPIPDMATSPYAGFETQVAGGASAEPVIPDLAPILAAPSRPTLGNTKLVSIAVTDDVPLKDVLLELSRLADIDIEVDANIAGGIAFRANQRPFSEVIERISDFAGLRYSMKNGVLRVERDSPYIEMYSLDFLNFDRSSSSSIDVNTSVLSGGEGGGDALNTGSSSSITTTSESDFWAQFGDGLDKILAFVPATRVSDFSAPQIQTALAAPVAPAASTEELEADPLAAASVASAIVAEAAETAASAAAATTTQTATSTAFEAQYTINKQAGTLTVLGSQRQQVLVKKFIKKLEYNSSAQVLIEAKIVEVTLNEDYESGIDWSRFGSGGGSVAGSAVFGGVNNPANVANFALNKTGLTGLDIDLNLAVEMTQVFGTTRTLSSPRLHAINNQPAVLTFAKNEVYFNVEIEKEESDTETSSDTTFTVTSEIKTVPIGIIMSLLPSVNRDTGEITLNVRPTLSRVVDRVVDPGLSLAIALDPLFSGIDIENEIPVVEVRELDSILKIKSGQVMVIGGLMEDKGTQDEAGVPGASEIPVLGHLFKATDRSRETKELVIFIRATLVDSQGYSHEADRRLYERYSQDPRPLKF